MEIEMPLSSSSHHHNYFLFLLCFKTKMPLRYFSIPVNALFVQPVLTNVNITDLDEYQKDEIEMEEFDNKKDNMMC